MVATGARRAAGFLSEALTTSQMATPATSRIGGRPMSHTFSRIS
jgi:hypothetical protein